MASPSGIVLRRWALALFVATIVLDVAFVMCASAVRGDPGLTYPDAGLEESEVVGSLSNSSASPPTRCSWTAEPLVQ